MAAIVPTTSVVVPSQDLNLPRSKIYVTAPSATQPTAAQSKTQRHKTAISDMHFLLILKCGNLYTQEELSNAEGRHRCYNCHRAIQGPIYLMPERFNPQTNEPVCNPIPHCRTSCVYRTVQDLPNNGNMVTNLFLMYGHDIVCAPSRFLLYVPGGMTLEEYHAAIDKKMTYETTDPLVHVFIAPVVVSCTVQRDHQLLESVVEYIDGIKASKKASIGPMKKSGVPEQVVVPLQPKLLAHTRLSDVFHPDPSSFGRPGVASNPHMVAPLQDVRE